MRIAVLDDYQHVAPAMADWNAIPGNPDIVFFHDHEPDEDRVAVRLKGFDVVCLMRERTPFPASLIDRLHDLRLIVTTGQRNASIDMAAASRRGIAVCGTDFSGTNPTAELTIALMLSLARGLPLQVASMRAGGWQVGLGRSLRGSILGIVGLGRLGGEVARLAAAFGMDVTAWSQNLTASRAAEAGARYVDKETLLKQSDFVSIHLKSSERTRKLIGAPELALMKAGAYLVNTSRGPIVDEAALIDALRAERIAGAALDVFDREPLPPGHPLRSLHNALLTPHVGYVTEEEYTVFFRGTVDAIIGFIDASPINLLNPDRKTS